MPYSRDWVSTTFPDHSTFASQPQSIKKIQVDVEERLKNWIYGFISGEAETSDGFKQVPLRAQANPTSKASCIQLYGKDVTIGAATDAELHVVHETGGAIQLTYAGKLWIEALKVASEAEGDILYRDATKWARLAKGTAAQQLRINAGATAPEWFTPSAAAEVPTGSIQMWPGALASPPSGYLVCDGSAVSRTTYSALFAITGTAFGSGDGSTTFNIPNFTNVFPYGANEGAGDGNASVGSRNANPTGGTGIGGNDNSVTYKVATTTSFGDSGAGFQNVNGNTSVMPPYIAVGFIIKT